MFSDFWNIASILRDSGFSDTQADAMQSIFAQCLGEYTHRGKLSLLGSRDIGATDAVLTVANYPHPPDAIDDPSPRNGCAIHIEAGKLCVDGAAEFNGPVAGIAGNGGSVCWGKVVSAGAGDATVGHTLGTVGTWESEVEVIPVTDSTGATPTGDPNRIVYCWRDHLTDPNFREDDVIPFVKDENDVGITTHGRDAKIGAHQERVDVTNPAGTPNYTAATGYRGWRVADGTNGTQNRGGKVSYGWQSGGGTFGTVATDVPLAFTGAATDDEIVAAISNHAAHDHTVAKSDITGAFTVDQDPANIQISTVLYDTEAFGAGTATDQALVTSVADPDGGLGHSHGLTVTGGGSTINTASTGPQSHTASGDDVAVTATVVQPAGETVLVLQRIN